MSADKFSAGAVGCLDDSRRRDECHVGVGPQGMMRTILRICEQERPPHAPRAEVVSAFVGGAAMFVCVFALLALVFLI